MRSCEVIRALEEYDPRFAKEFADTLHRCFTNGRVAQVINFADAIRSVPNVRFSLENGSDFLCPHFVWFESRVLRDVLKFTDSQPLMDYYASGFMKLGDTANAIADEQWHRVYEWVRKQVDDMISRYGHFSLPKTAGFFVVQKP